jgi:hypothetical protein
MKKAGFGYRTPQDANNDPVFHTETPTAKEISTAVADVKCKQEENVIGVWSAAEIAYQQRYIEANRLQLDEVKKSYEAVLRNAAEVLTAR